MQVLRVSLCSAVVAGAAAVCTAPLMAPQGSSRAAVRMQTNGGIKLGDNSKDPGAGNYRRLSDKLKEADVERRLEDDAIRVGCAHC